MQTESVSVIVCCHNSEKRLPETIAHLAAQDCNDSLPWELIVVDNASTDSTANVAKQLWPKNHPIPLKVVVESKPGLTFARARGVRESRYPILSLVDDDNWVSPNWVRLTSEIMRDHPKVAIVNGIGTPVCEVDPPEWFDEYAHLCFAVTGPKNPTGDITQTLPYPFGAGMGIRRSALDALEKQGFVPILTDRQGKKLTSGGDTELCKALRLAGWHWWRDPRLQFSHFLPKTRVTWDYCRRLGEGCGAAYVALDLYDLAHTPEPVTFSERLRDHWMRVAKWSLDRILANPKLLFKVLTSDCVADREAFQLIVHIGRLKALLQWRSGRTRALSEIRRARWSAAPGEKAAGELVSR